MDFFTPIIANCIGVIMTLKQESNIIYNIDNDKYLK